MTKTAIGRGIFVILALFFIGTGLTMMFSPSLMLTHMFFGPVDSVGALSSVRSVFASMSIGLWIGVIIGAYSLNKAYIFPAFLSLNLVLVGRVVGYALDGPFPELIESIIPTLIAIILMIVAFKLTLGKNED